MDAKIRMIKLYEMKPGVTQPGVLCFSSTGRAILMPEDAPVFKQMGEAGVRALVEGQAAISPDMYELLANVIKESEHTTDPATEVSK